MNRFIKDVQKYYQYLIYTYKSELKAEVADSYLNWLWWVLDPLLFMFVYMFVALVVFGKSEQYFPVYVFLGLFIWQFFEKTLKQSIKLVAANKTIITKVYLPKFILVLVRVLVNGFKMLISFGLVTIMLFVFKVPISIRILWVFPLVLVLLLLTFGFSCLLMHFGVFVEDLFNVINVLLKLLFYTTGIFYSIKKRVPAPWNNILLKYNPVAFIIDSIRECVLYENSIHIKFLIAWFVFGIFISAISVRTIYKYENSYVKVV